MPKINVDSDYFDHPKTHRLRVYCGPEADIYPIRLWSFCAKYFPKDGVLRGYSASEIEGVMGWKGATGNLINALERVGFVEKENSDFSVKDWQEHAGFIWKYKRAGRMAGKKSGASRALKRKTNERIANGLGKSVQRIGNDPRTIELNGIELNKDSTSAPPEAVGLAEKLRDLILKNNPNARIPDDMKRWSLEADRLLRINKVPLAEAGAVLQWCQEDTFWRSNILSMEKFRMQYDQLLLKSKVKERKQSVVVG